MSKNSNFTTQSIFDGLRTQLLLLPDLLSPELLPPGLLWRLPLLNIENIVDMGV